jgi:hypothetical protein
MPANEAAVRCTKLAELEHEHTQLLEEERRAEVVPWECKVVARREHEAAEGWKHEVAERRECEAEETRERSHQQGWCVCMEAEGLRAR